MAFRNGTKGEDLWPKCLAAGVAVISYEGMDFDLSKHSPGKPAERWGQLKGNQVHSLRTFAYEIKKNDIIYVKSGPSIVGRGIVKHTYQYDKKSQIRDSFGGRWPHSIDIRWTKFHPIKILVGGPQNPTIRDLTPDEVTKLDRQQSKATTRTRDRVDMEAREGQILVRQARFRSRNRGLIDAIKASSDYRCSVCDFKFGEVYGEIGNEYIIAHHIEPLGMKRGQSRTSSDDITLLCANCHAMIHARLPPFRPEQLRKSLKKHWHFQ